MQQISLQYLFLFTNVFTTDFNRVLLQLTDILNTLFKYCVNYWQLNSSRKHLNRGEKLFYLLFVNIQCIIACSLKKLTLKFKLLSLAVVSIKIAGHVGVNADIQTLKIYLKSMLPFLKYATFKGVVFYWCTLYMHKHKHLKTSKNVTTDILSWYVSIFKVLQPKFPGYASG